MNLGRRDRERRPARRAAFRDCKPIILVVCEGAVTEREYLRALATANRNSRVYVKVSDVAGRDPLSLVQVAKEQKEAADKKAKKQEDDNLAFDQVWCVYDIDDHPNEKISTARQLANSHGIELAVSNPCAELWLYLHFATTGQIDRHKLASLLKKRVPKYDKHIDFKDFEATVPKAIQEAKALDKLATQAGTPGQNPTTGVYRLVEEIQRV